MIGRILKEGIITVLSENLEYKLDEQYSLARYIDGTNRRVFEKLERRVAELEKRLEMEHDDD